MTKYTGSKYASGLAIFLAFSLTLFAQTPPSGSIVPQIVNYSGLLKDASGRPVTKVSGATFLIYKDESGGAPLWLETQSVKPDAAGHYTVQLGAASPHGLPAEVFMSGEARWLAVQIGSEAERGRVLLVAVPYAMKAADAETLGGLPLSAFVLAPASRGAATPSADGAKPSTPPPTSSSVTTNGGTVNTIPLFSTATDIENSAITQAGTGSAAKIGINNTAPLAVLDVKGSTTIRGILGLAATGVATAAAGKNSQPVSFIGSSFNSGTAAAVNQTFRWLAEPAANNTASPSATLSLLYGSGATTPTETGLKIASNGQITFAAGQTFPGGGSGTITGVTAGTGLTGGGTTGTVTLNLDATKVPLLSAANIFTNNQSVTGSVTASGVVSAGTVNAGSAFNLQGAPFAYGSSASNLFLGFSTGNTSATGTLNLGIGSGTLPVLTLGIGNVAIGWNVLSVDTTGSENTGVGRLALQLNTGSSNTAVGERALQNTTFGSENTAVGIAALVNNTTGNDNTALGVQAGPDQSTPGLSNSTAIGANALVTRSNSLVLGSISGLNGATADTFVGIGTTAPAAKLDVRGTASFAGLVSFAAGQTFPGVGTITGVAAGTGLTGGGSSGNVTLNLDPTKVAQLGTANTFTGNQTVNANLTSTGVVSAGSYQIGSHLFGYGDTTNNNVYLGFAGNKTTTGFGNTGVGGQALLTIGGGANNTAVGQAALVNNSLGTDNMAIGVDALVNNTTGSYNTAGGVWALRYNTGSNNTGLGFLAGPDSGHPNLTNATAIGANAVVSESNAVVLGGTGANAVKVGIGTTTPAYDLHVNGAVRAETGLLVGGNAPVTVDAPGIVGGRLAVLANGNVGINNANPQSTLDVGGTVRIGGDLPMSSNPRMSFSGMFPGSFCGNYLCGNTSGCTGTYCAGPGGYFVPDKGILITRITVVVSNTVDPSCYVLPSIQVTTPGNGYGLSIQGNNVVDSGPISIPVSGGAPVTISSSQAYDCNLGTSGGGGAFVNVQYVMQ